MIGAPAFIALRYRSPHVLGGHTHALMGPPTGRPTDRQAAKDYTAHDALSPLPSTRYTALSHKETFCDSQPAASTIKRPEAMSTVLVGISFENEPERALWRYRTPGSAARHRAPPAARKTAVVAVHVPVRADAAACLAFLLDSLDDAVEDAVKFLLLCLLGYAAYQAMRQGHASRRTARAVAVAVLLCCHPPCDMLADRLGDKMHPVQNALRRGFGYREKDPRPDRGVTIPDGLSLCVRSRALYILRRAPAHTSLRLKC